MLAVFVSILEVSYSLAFNREILLRYSDHNSGFVSLPIAQKSVFRFSAAEWNMVHEGKKNILR